MRTLVLLRHGQSQWNKENRFTGWVDVPLSAEGVLCFQEFGWDLLDVLDSVGFSRREVITCWAPDLGYYGSFQPFIVAWR